MIASLTRPSLYVLPSLIFRSFSVPSYLANLVENVWHHRTGLAVRPSSVGARAYVVCQYRFLYPNV